MAGPIQKLSVDDSSPVREVIVIRDSDDSSMSEETTTKCADVVDVDSKKGTTLMNKMMGNVEVRTTPVREEKVVATSASSNKQGKVASVKSSRHVGARVYSRYLNGEYYWGRVVKEFRKGHSCQSYYAIEYDDGDYMEEVEGQFVFSVDTCRAKFKIEPPSVSQSASSSDDSDSEEETETPCKRASKVANAKQSASLKRKRVDELQNCKSLVGKNVCWQWLDRKGRKKLVFGTITGDVIVSGQSMYSVRYNEHSRKAANIGASESGSFIPETRLVTIPVACSGCVIYDEQINGIVRSSNRFNYRGKVVVCQTWITPAMRTEEVVTRMDGSTVPRLSIVVRGFLLTFSVKTSTIIDGGNGVFVKAAKVAPSDHEDFMLNEGEFLDLGVYAPNRPTDRKSERVNFVKSFIHSFQSEAWCFDSIEPEYVFDITSDVTGTPHDEAQKNILIYFNECSCDNEQSLRADYDPEGNVHYIMGVCGRLNKRLIIPANGIETELFVKYGGDYEPVRRREGYSPNAVQAKKHSPADMRREEQRYIKEIKKFSMDEVAACLDFFRGVFSNEDSSRTSLENMRSSARSRSLRILKIFEGRVKTFESSTNVQRLIETIQELTLHFSSSNESSDETYFTCTGGSLSSS